MKRCGSLAALLLGAACTLTAAGTLSREGAYWVQTISGSVPLHSRGVLKVNVRGPVIVQGVASEGVHYVLKKRVRADSEAEAHRLLGQIEFRAARGRDDAFLSMSMPARPRASAELHVRAPAQTAKAWVDTQAGDIQVYDIAGDVHADSGAGLIRMDRIGGAVHARTAGGDVRLGQIGGGARCFTGGGRIEVDRTGEESWFESAGGEILVYNSGGPVHASTAGGNIRVGRAAASVSAKTYGGRIDVHDAGGIVVAGSYGGAIQVGSARGVRLEATGGSIQLHGSTGELRAVSDVGSILAELGAGGRLQDSALSTGAGDITVFIPSDLALTVRAQNENGQAGRIVSEFREILIRHATEVRRAPVLAEGALNGGGPVLQLTSGGGTIYLRRLQR